MINAENLREFRDMLIDIRDRVQKLKKQGKDLNAIIAAKPTQKYDEKWGKAFFTPDQFTTIVYKSL
jgi:hypothetical protein